MMQDHEEEIPENATEVKFVTPEFAMTECEPLRAEIQVAADKLRALKEIFFARDDVKAMPLDTVDVLSDSEVASQHTQVKDLTIKLGKAMKAAGNPTFLPYLKD